MAHMFVKTHGDRINMCSVVTYLAVWLVRGLAAMTSRASGRPPETPSRVNTVAGPPGKEQAPQIVVTLVGCYVRVKFCDADVTARVLH